jgi:zinc/manganese transport system substrate-binding protein
VRPATPETSPKGHETSGSRAVLAATVLAVLASAAVLTACGPTTSAVGETASKSRPDLITAVGAENEYANVIGQIGGRYVAVSAIMSNPNTDPHTFEASSVVERAVSDAQVVVQNGVGYDTFMNTIESAAPNAKRKVIDVQTLRRLPDSTPNPHLWYSPLTMPAVASALVRDLSAIQPSHAAYFRSNAMRFDHSLKPWLAAMAHFRTTYPDAAVATTEPVGDYMLEAVGADDRTPFGLQADIMNGVDPAPQYVSLQDGLFSHHEVKALVYNEQVTDSVTQSFLDAARANHIAVVGVYETMPTPGYDYQSWMRAEVEALQKAVADNVSTPKL